MRPLTGKGAWRGLRVAPGTGAAKATAVRQRKADHAAFAMLPILERLHCEGVTGLNELARRLNDMGHPTPRKKQSKAADEPAKWTATAVKRALARVA